MGLQSQSESEYTPICACAYMCLYTYSKYNQAEQLGVNISVAKAVAQASGPRRVRASPPFAGPAEPLPALPQEKPCSPLSPFLCLGEAYLAIVTLQVRDSHKY